MNVFNVFINIRNKIGFLNKLNYICFNIFGGRGGGYGMGGEGWCVKSVGLEVGIIVWFIVMDCCYFIFLFV